ncbi:MAG: hypothetical protein ACFCBV_10725 [Phycisphaerales bacterium]
MSDRCCLIERDERGDRIRAVRLIGQHADAIWSSPRVDGRYVSDAADDADAAAEWIAERLSMEGDTLGLVVVDTTGSRCGWVHAASAEAAAVRSAYGRGGEVGEDDFDVEIELDDDEPAEGDALGSRPTSVEASIEPLGPAYESAEGLRVGVLVVPDAIVRLFIDGLNQRGIEFGGVTSLWHVVGWAAGPGESYTDSARVVADSPTVSCGVLVQPEGRLIWAWCRDGAVLAAGSLRLSLHDDGPIVSESDVARLINDWVAWSAQVGASPGRVLLSACPLAGSPAFGDEEAMSIPALANRLADLWPEAVLDIEAPEDPVLDVLRLAQESQRDSLDPGYAMIGLATRPGRSMRRVYQLGALALVAGGLALAAVGLRWQGQVESVRADAEAIREAYVANMAEIEARLGLPSGRITGDPIPEFAIVREVDQATRASQVTRDPPRPVIQELESLSFLFGELGDRVELDAVTVTSITGTGALDVKMTTDDAAIVGEINALLRDLGMNDGAVNWSATSRAQGSRYEVRMIGRWQRREGQS